MQSWLRSGEFSSKARLWYAPLQACYCRDSVRSNIIYYTLIAIVAIPALLYILFVLKIDTWGSFLAFAMAGANAWGLLLATIMLGYGLVDIPKQLWHSSNPAKALLDLEMQGISAKSKPTLASKVRESMVDAEAEIYQTSKDISNVEKKVSTNNDLRPFVERLLLKCPNALDRNGFEGDDKTPNPVSRQYLVDLHARVKRASKIHDREKA